MDLKSGVNQLTLVHVLHLNIKKKMFLRGKLPVILADASISNKSLSAAKTKTLCGDT